MQQDRVRQLLAAATLECKASMTRNVRRLVQVYVCAAAPAPQYLAGASHQGCSAPPHLSCHHSVAHACQAAAQVTGAPHGVRWLHDLRDQVPRHREHSSVAVRCEAAGHEPGRVSVVSGNAHGAVMSTQHH